MSSSMVTKDKIIEKAKELYQNGDVDIELNPRTIKVRGGTWVEAWVHVPNSSLEEIQ